MAELTLTEMLTEFAAAQSYTGALVDGLDDAQTAWRPSEMSSAIRWHLGHQGAVNHFMVRNLTAAEVSFDEGFDKLFDSATPEPARGDLPSLEQILGYREAIAASTRSVIERIEAGDVGAPAQLTRIAQGLLTATINHEYQHSKWVEEVRGTMTSDPAPVPQSDRLTQVDGYWML